MADAYASNHYGLVTWALSQMTASLQVPYTIAGAFLFQIPFHFLAGITTSTEAFFYAVLVNIVTMSFTEAIIWCVVEGTKNAQLAVTGGVTVMGTFYLYRFVWSTGGAGGWQRCSRTECVSPATVVRPSARLQFARLPSRAAPFSSGKRPWRRPCPGSRTSCPPSTC
jgi:hypothetical protein